MRVNREAAYAQREQKVALTSYESYAYIHVCDFVELKVKLYLIIHALRSAAVAAATAEATDIYILMAFIYLS